jgi:probable glucitol transport protein GutA
MKAKLLNSHQIVANGFGEAGFQMMGIIQSSFILYFLVNFGGVSAVTIGFVMLVARIWDAVNDPMMGMLVDNTNTRWGKARPYLVLGAFPTAFFLAMLFYVPQSATSVIKTIWITIAYIGFGTFLTMVSIPYSTLIVRVTDNSSERLALARSRSILGTIGIIIPPLLFTLFAVGKVNESNNMRFIVLLLGVLYVLFNLIVFFSAKEISRETDSVKVKIAEAIPSLLRNKYWIILSCSYLVYGIMYGISNGVMMFYLTSRYNKPELFLPLMGFIMVAMLIASALSKPLAERYGKRKFVLMGLSIATLGYIMRWGLNDINIIVYAVGFGISQFGSTFYHVALRPMIADAIDYGETKTGFRVESVAFSGLTFTNKVGISFSSIILGILLEKSGYIEGVIEQPASAINALFGASVIIPFFTMVILMLLINMYRIEDNIESIQEKMIV